MLKAQLKIMASDTITTWQIDGDTVETVVDFILGFSKSLQMVTAAAAVKSLQSCPTLCNPIDGSPLGSPIPGILQARTQVGFHLLLQCMKVRSEGEVTQLCPTLHNPMDCSLPGSSIHGIFLARVLEWGAIAFSGRW